MKSNTSIKSIISVIAMALALVVSVSRANPVSTISVSATEVVFQAQGYLDANAEAEEITNRASFRDMARFNENLMNILIVAGQSPIGIAYFRGRAQAFHAVADALGEP